ncbi:MAG: hypothetical protein ACK5OR_01935, partial [Betaproteobacteria bacterium]
QWRRAGRRRGAAGAHALLNPPAPDHSRSKKMATSKPLTRQQYQAQLRSLSGTLNNQIRALTQTRRELQALVAKVPGSKSLKTANK